MKEITNDQLIYIEQQVEKNGVNLRGLKNELIDHICCIVETKMQQGSAFETAYQYAYASLNPDGLNQIQKETIYNTTPKSYFVMKKMIYFLAMIATMCIFTGILFKMLHLPGAGILIALSVLSLIILLLPMILISFYNREKEKNSLTILKYASIYLSISLLILAVGTTILKFAGAPIMIGLSVFIMVVGFLPSYFISLYNKAKSSHNLAKYSIGYVGLSLFISGVLLKILHLQGAALILALGVLVVNFGFLPLLFYGFYKKNTPSV